MHENRRKRRRRISAVAAALATSVATLVGLVGFSGAPAFAGTNANTSYEFDCTTALSAGQVAPFIATANLTAAPDPSFPSGATFGASGALSFTLSGGFIAGFAANGVLTPAGVGLNVHDLTLAPTDANSTGSYAYNHSFSQVPAITNTVSSVTWTSGSTTLSGAFAAGDVGKGVTGGTGLPQGATIVAVTAGTDATINAPTTAAQASGTTVTLYAPMTFTDASVSTGNVFTTAGATGGTANIAAVTASGFDAVVALPVTFGKTSGGEGVGSANCLATGWDASANPGPAQLGAATPQTPPGATTPLVLASGGFIAQPGTTQQITPPASSFVALNDAPPVAQSKSYLLNEGTSKTITLIATDTDATPVTGFTIVPGSISDARLAVGVPAANGEVTISDSGSGTQAVTFEFTASDANGPGNVATATINITSTKPVDEPLTQNVNGGQLVLSCSNPDTNGGSPLLTCPEFQFPDITLNGLQQTSTGNGSTLYVSDNRGDFTAPAWSLTATMVATPIGSGSNTNASCDGIVAFCNETAGTHALDANGQIAPSNLSIGSITCAPHSGNLNPAATPGAGGSFAGLQQICQAVSSTQQGGTFDVTKTYTLTVPSSVYAGKYWGTVEFVVQ